MEIKQKKIPDSTYNRTCMHNVTGGQKSNEIVGVKALNTLNAVLKPCTWIDPALE